MSRTAPPARRRPSRNSNTAARGAFWQKTCSAGRECVALRYSRAPCTNDPVTARSSAESARTCAPTSASSSSCRARSSRRSSARTEREPAAPRAEIDTDGDYLPARVRDDADPRNLVRRQPLAVFGTLGSLAAIVGVAIAARVKSFRRSRTEKELDQIVQRLGG